MGNSGGAAGGRLGSFFSIDPIVGYRMLFLLFRVVFAFLCDATQSQVFGFRDDFDAGSLRQDTFRSSSSFCSLDALRMLIFVAPRARLRVEASPSFAVPAAVWPPLWPAQTHEAGGLGADIGSRGLLLWPSPADPSVDEAAFAKLWRRLDPEDHSVAPRLRDALWRKELPLLKPALASALVACVAQLTMCLLRRRGLIHGQRQRRNIAFSAQRLTKVEAAWMAEIRRSPALQPQRRTTTNFLSGCRAFRRKGTGMCPALANATATSCRLARVAPQATVVVCYCCSHLVAWPGLPPLRGGGMLLLLARLQGYCRGHPHHRYYPCATCAAAAPALSSRFYFRARSSIGPSHPLGCDWVSAAALELAPQYLLKPLVRKLLHLVSVHHLLLVRPGKFLPEDEHTATAGVGLPPPPPPRAIVFAFSLAGSFFFP